MGFIDANGNPVDPAAVDAAIQGGVRRALRAGVTGNVSTIPEVKQKAKGAVGFLKRNIPPVAAMTGGGIAGTALGTALAPETGGLSLALPILLGAGGAGAANVAATKGLPPDYGGDPSQSAKSAFLWGAIPDLVGGGAATGLESRMARTGSEAVERGTQDFEKEAAERAASTHKSLADALSEQAPTMADVNSVRSRLGGTTGTIPTGEARQAQTFAYRDAALGPIDRQRKALGNALNGPYSKLKGITAPVEDVRDFQNIGATIRSGMNSPISGQVNGLIADTEALAPPKPPDYVLRGESRPVTTGPGGDFEQNDAYQLALKNYKPPTADRLLELRQRATNMLANAKGGDIHALLDLRQALDDKLSNFLPDVSKERAAYKSFSDLYPWRDINQLRRQPTGSDVAKWAFGRKPEQALEIVQNATPAEKPVLRQAYADRVLSNVDPDLPAPQQMKQIRKALAPDIQNGLIKDLYGSADHQDLRNIIYTPIHREQWAKQFATPRGRHAYTVGFTNAARAGVGSETAAAEEGLRNFVASLPPEGQRAFSSMAGTVALPNQSLPVLLSPEQMARQGIAESLGGPSQLARYAGRRAEFALPQTAARAAMGGGAGLAYGASTGAAFAAILATSAGYRAAMKLGGASAVARLYAAPMGRAAGKAAFHFLSAIGSRTGENLTQTGAQ